MLFSFNKTTHKAQQGPTADESKAEIKITKDSEIPFVSKDFIDLDSMLSNNPKLCDHFCTKRAFLKFLKSLQKREE